jgi:hypothetical protein
LGEAAGVGAVEVVVAEVLLEIALEGGQLGHERAGEGGSPVLLEDRLLQTLDVAVRGRSAGADPSLLDAEVLQSLAEVAGAKLGAVVGDDRLQLPAGRGELRGYPLDERAAVLGAGVARRGVELGPGEAGRAGRRSRRSARAYGA